MAVPSHTALPAGHRVSRPLGAALEKSPDHVTSGSLSRSDARQVGPERTAPGAGRTDLGCMTGTRSEAIVDCILDKSFFARWWPSQGEHLNVVVSKKETAKVTAPRRELSRPFPRRLWFLWPRSPPTLDPEPIETRGIHDSSCLDQSARRAVPASVSRDNLVASAFTIKCFSVMKEVPAL